MDSQFDAIRVELDAYRAFARSVQRAQYELEARLREAGAQETAAGDPLPRRIDVLVRLSAGPKKAIYHYADAPCRRVTGSGRTLDNFRLMAEPEAQRDGLVRCSACKWPPIPAK